METNPEKSGFRWGIMGCGLIAPKFAQAMERTGEGRVAAVASRSLRRARRLQRLLGYARAYGSYEEMLDREKLDAVYVATTHNFHAAHARAGLERGLPVLVEKPFTQNAAQAEETLALARQARLFCMEAMWTRFNPATVRLRQMLADGAIGKVERLRADFCVRMPPWTSKMMPWNRMFNPRLAGGALLDIGVYPIAYARMLFNAPPATIQSSANMAWTGVDKSSEYRFGYDGGACAEIAASFVQERPREAWITGSEGSVHVPAFSLADQFTLVRRGAEPETIRCEAVGFEHEIREVHRCLREGRIESESMPLDESLETMRTMDAIRAQWGMAYPGEHPRKGGGSNPADRGAATGKL